MPLIRGGGYGHKIIYERPDEYVLVWYYDTKSGRLRHPRKRTRDTNRKGAERFAKKWRVAMPKENP
jgi:hypothetical protein